MNVEKYISLAEIESKSGNLELAVKHAKKALLLETSTERTVALRIFIAKCYSKMGKIKESNSIYRGLVNEKNYLPPVIMGLIYNNFQDTEKTGRNLNLMRIFIREN